MSEQEKNMVEEQPVENNEAEVSEEPEKKETFLQKISKPMKPLFAWLIFGGAIALIVIIGIIILTNIK